MFPLMQLLPFSLFLRPFKYRLIHPFFFNRKMKFPPSSDVESNSFPVRLAHAFTSLHEPGSVEIILRISPGFMVSIIFFVFNIGIGQFKPEQSSSLSKSVIIIPLSFNESAPFTRFHFLLAFSHTFENLLDEWICD